MYVNVSFVVTSNNSGDNTIECDCTIITVEQLY